jgi:hypothetical protein
VAGVDRNGDAGWAGSGRRGPATVTRATGHPGIRVALVPSPVCGDDCLGHDDEPRGPVVRAMRLAALVAVIVGGLAVLLLPERVR